MKKVWLQEAEFYGAANLIFDNRDSPICLRATWMHGLGPPLKNFYHKSVVIHYDETFLPLHLVNNLVTKKHLLDQGVDSIAVGMPIIYAKNFTNNNYSRKFKRVYFPAHSTAHQDKYNIGKCIENLRKYDCDAISLTGLDYKRLINEDINLKNQIILRGASSADSGSLERMAESLFSTKEMITDFPGSHIVYAAACGVKVRFTDDIIDNCRQPSHNNYRAIPKRFHSLFQRMNDPKYFITSFSSSVWFNGNDYEKKEYAEHLLGIEFKKDVNQIKDYLSPVSIAQSTKIISSLLMKKIHRKIMTH